MKGSEGLTERPDATPSTGSCSLLPSPSFSLLLLFCELSFYSFVSLSRLLDFAFRVLFLASLCSPSSPAICFVKIRRVNEKLTNQQKMARGESERMESKEKLEREEEGQRKETS